MRAIVDQEACISCGLCPEICPEVFQMQPDGKAKEIVDEVPANLEDKAKEAAESCPTSAIAIE